MTDLTEAMRIDPAARTGPLDVEKTLPDVSPELGPNIPEVVQEIDPDREKRLTQEQQERTRLRNLGIISQPTELKYKLPKSGVERTLMADVKSVTNYSSVPVKVSISCCKFSPKRRWKCG